MLFDGTTLSDLSDRALARGLQAGGEWPEANDSLEGLVINVQADFRDAAGEAFNGGSWYECVGHDGQYRWIAKLGPAQIAHFGVNLFRERLSELDLPTRPKVAVENAAWAQPLRDEGLGDVYVEMVHHVGGDSTVADWPYDKIQQCAPQGVTPEQAVVRVLEILKEKKKTKTVQAILEQQTRRNLEVNAQSLDQTYGDGTPVQLEGALKDVHQIDLSLHEMIMRADLERSLKSLSTDLAEAIASPATPGNAHEVSILQAAIAVVEELNAPNNVELRLKVELLEDALSQGHQAGNPFSKIFAQQQPPSRAMQEWFRVHVVKEVLSRLRDTSF